LKNSRAVLSQAYTTIVNHYFIWMISGVKKEKSKAQTWCTILSLLSVSAFCCTLHSPEPRTVQKRHRFHTKSGSHV